MVNKTKKDETKTAQYVFLMQFFAKLSSVWFIDRPKHDLFRKVV